MTQTRQKADRIRARALQLGATVTYRGQIVTVEIPFTANDTGAYAVAESEAYELILAFPMVGAGSIWGTTSDGVGGVEALRLGRMRLNMSCPSRRLAGHFA